MDKINRELLIAIRKAQQKLVNQRDVSAVLITKGSSLLLDKHGLNDLLKAANSYDEHVGMDETLAGAKEILSEGIDGGEA